MPVWTGDLMSSQIGSRLKRDVDSLGRSSTLCTLKEIGGSSGTTESDLSKVKKVQQKERQESGRGG